MSFVLALPLANSLIQRNVTARAANSNHDVADLGSDPNSAIDKRLRQQPYRELGSDPNSAARGGKRESQRDQSSIHNDSYKADAPAMLHRLTVARRIGVRAQFGEPSLTKPSPFGRIGIRPQICYRCRIADSRVGVRPQTGQINCCRRTARHAWAYPCRQVHSTLTPIVLGIPA